MKRIFALAALLLVSSAAGLRGQETRADLVDAALETADDATRLGLLIQALDPALGAPDSVWAVGAFSLAFRLSETGRESEAATWLRWAAREGSALGLEPSDYPALFPPPLQQAYDEARAAVEADGGAEPRVTSSWSWTDALATSPGGLVVEVEGGGDGTVAEVEGVGAVGPGERRALPPGTYRVVVSGGGGDPVAVEREVLPGIDRRLTVRLGDPLDASARAGAEASLVRLRRSPAGAAVCTDGVVVGDGDFLVAPLAVLEAGPLEVVLPDGRVVSGVEVPVRDAQRGVGVARLGDVGVPGLDLRGGVTGPAWVVYREGCGPVAVRRVSLGDGPGPVVDVDAPAETAGGAVVDDEGRLVALGLGTTALLADEMDRLLERAEAAVVVAAGPGGEGGGAVDDGGGGFPIKWVAAGAAAVGVAAVLLLGGDDDGNGGGRTGIVITWPGG